MAFRRLIQPRQLSHVKCYCQKTTITSGTTEGPKPAQKIENENQKELQQQIISKEGDNGTSRSLTGDVLPKDSKIFSAIGATEELLSYLGLAREHAHESEQEFTDKLKRIQTIVIDISTAISKQNSKTTIPPNYTKELEDWITEYSKQLPPPERYIIPGGGVAAASLHVARAICRRTERELVSLVNAGQLDKEAQVYLNRLSDFLFTISRIAAKHDQRTESIYIPKPDETIQEQ